MLSQRLLPLLLYVPVCTFSAGGQTYTARHIVFKNAGASFTQAQLEAASGLHPGMSFTVPEISAAAQKLVDSGYFDDVSAGVEGGAGNLTVEFVLKPSDASEFLTAGFSNFVWLTPEQIKAAILSKLPLYNGTLPEVGSQADIAAAALTAALSAQNVAGAHFQVVHETAEPTLACPERVMEFRVADPYVTVSSIDFAAATPAIQPLLDKGAAAALHRPYSEGPAGVTTAEEILAPLEDAGYAQAILGKVTMQMGPVTAVDGHGQVGVALTVTPVPGPQYRVSALEFAGTPVESAADFAKTATLRAGDVASRKALLATLRPVDTAYRSKGYLDVMVKTEPVYNTAAGTVSYTVSVEPGDVYTVKSVTAENLDPVAKADFDKYFLLKPGAVYDPAYVARFIKDNTALASLKPYSGSFKAYAHPATHTVDLDITFVGAGSSPQVQQTVAVH